MSEFNQRLVIGALLVICIGAFAFLSEQAASGVVMAVITGLAGMYQNKEKL